MPEVKDIYEDGEGEPREQAETNSALSRTVGRHLVLLCHALEFKPYPDGIRDIHKGLSKVQPKVICNS